jgi:hypothetical protein
MQNRNTNGRETFIETMQLYIDGVVQQSEDRTHDRIRSIDEYWAIRRHASGYFPAFTLIELELDFPEDVYHHPLFKTLRDCALHSICVGNVSLLILSTIPQADDSHRIFTLIMLNELAVMHFTILLP